MVQTTLNTLDLVPGLARTISVLHLTSADCNILSQILTLWSGTKVLGLSLRLSKKGSIEAVALATPTLVFLITVVNEGSSGSAGIARVFDHPECLLASFAMPRLALVLYAKFGAHIQGVDLSTLHSISPRKQKSVSEVTSDHLSQRARAHDINALWLRKKNDDLCLQAWLSASIAEKSIDKIAKTLKVDTRHLQPHQLSCLSRLVVNVELIDANKPTVANNDFAKVVNLGGRLILYNERFKTRVRRSNQTVIEINGGKVKARAEYVNGRQTELTVLKGKLQGSVQKVRVLGREEATCAELDRDEHVLCMLQGTRSLLTPPFVRMLWFAAGGKKSKGRKAIAPPPPVYAPSFAKLNQSQREVASAMVSDGKPLVVAHGPPGTGKTTTIAAAVDYWQSFRRPAWVIAQSNVGVKNIARSLFKKNIDFRLIVSKEFHFEWHEHLYSTIEDKLIRSDDIGESFDPKNHIGETKVMLCTLSMLSNPCLDLYGVFRYVPVERLVVDEASQIDTFEFMHLFHKFQEKLEKVCMFGDPKQLPPFGSDVAPKMKTIFDYTHLQGPTTTYFLDTQYRMPVPLGDFISKAVYKSKLKSVHDITDSTCIRFVDVRKGEEQRMGSSLKNMEEVHAIVNIVKNYYRHEEFCVITPYDAQRAAITTALKKAELPSEQVYNVDSFQGHEAPYVIVSAVRTSSPGFLRSLNRMNVMLTRCEAGMVLVTQRAFLRGGGKDTLLGRLAAQWEQRVGEDAAWVDAMRVAERRASLPGALRAEESGVADRLSAMVSALALW